MAYKLPKSGSIATYLPPTVLPGTSGVGRGVSYILPWWIELDVDNPEGHMKAARAFYEKERAAFRKSRQKDKLGDVEKTWKVKDYTVTRLSNGTYTCTCKGFQFRKQCKHIKGVQESV